MSPAARGSVQTACLRGRRAPEQNPAALAQVRVQENSSEIPAGSMPRTMDVILRHEAVEKCKAGDKCIFTGMLTVLPEVRRSARLKIDAAHGSPAAPADLYVRTVGAGQVAPASMYGDRAEARSGGDANSARDGLTGLKALGVRDLHYKVRSASSASRPCGFHQLSRARHCRCASWRAACTRSTSPSTTRYDDVFSTTIQPPCSLLKVSRFVCRRRARAARASGRRRCSSSSRRRSARRSRRCSRTRSSTRRSTAAWRPTSSGTRRSRRACC
jgi:hypothetical protein